jgi:DNA invertase Pin-like site-specific DNA recombinase
MRVALYLRVSTTDQEPESQGREVRAFVTARGWETVETYQDVGISGARARRPGLDQLVKDAWRGRFEAVVVWDLSRMARSTLHALQLLQEFEQMKVRLIAVKQTFDTDTPLGRAFFTLAAMFAELERSILIERVRAGMARARAEGKKIGRPTRRVDLSELAKLRGQGLSIRQVARTMGIPTSTVAKRLASLAPPPERAEVTADA